MAWGLKKTDDLGLESFFEASEPEKSLSEKFVYKAVKRVDVNIPGQMTNDDEWREFEQRYLPITSTAMWRPVRGIWEDSKRERTLRERLGPSPE